MTVPYETLLKEQLMHNLLGYHQQSLKDYTELLIQQNKADSYHILQAYLKINRELIGQ